MSQPQWIVDFEERNGTDYVQANNWLYYPNGAVREANPYGNWNNPPVDELERLNNQLIYAKLKFEITAESFEGMHRGLRSALEGPYVPAEQEFVKLEKLQEHVTKLKRTYRKLKKQISNHPISVAKRKTTAAGSQDNADAKARLAKLRI